MFVLRRITLKNLENNTSLGDSYNLIDKERNKEDYEFAFKTMKWSAPDEMVYGFISYNEGSKLIPLYKKSTYFIMASNGQTFANISYKH